MAPLPPVRPRPSAVWFKAAWASRACPWIPWPPPASGSSPAMPACVAVPACPTSHPRWRSAVQTFTRRRSAVQPFTRRRSAVQTFTRRRVRSACMVVTGVQAETAPFLEYVLEPLTAGGFLKTFHCDLDLTRHAIYHDAVCRVHITGSDRTHDAIAWGSGVRRARRQHITRHTRDPGTRANPGVRSSGSMHVAPLRPVSDALAGTLQAGTHACSRCSTCSVPAVCMREPCLPARPVITSPLVGAVCVCVLLLVSVIAVPPELQCM